MTAYGVALTIGLLAVAIPLVAFARRRGIPYPVVLVGAGLILGFIPGLPQIPLDPSLVLVVFLPPLLYWESLTAPIEEMRDNSGHIWLLAVGLAAFTALVVAVTVHAVIPGFSWALALLLGAIVAPTDELAAVVTLERLPLPRYVVAVIEGESLLNDASALILYGIALTALTLHQFNPLVDIARGVLAVAGGAVLGWIVSVLAAFAWRRFRDADLQRTISFSIPFAAYGPAQALGLSGVIATIVLGIRANRSTPYVLSPATRIAGTGYWETVVFFANVLLYLLLGLQLHTILTHVLSIYPAGILIRDALLLNVAIVVVRFAWILGQEYLPAINGKTKHPEPNPRHAVIVAWSGMRGAVSLAAAIALPLSLGGSGTAIRDLIVFLAFSVILVTLFFGGLTLPFVARALVVPGEVDADQVELRMARGAMADAARQRVAVLQKKGRIDERGANALLGQVAAHVGTFAGEENFEAAKLRHAERSVLGAERDALLDLWKRRAIDNTIFRSLQRLLDLAEERLGSPEASEMKELPEPSDTNA